MPMSCAQSTLPLAPWSLNRSTKTASRRVARSTVVAEMWLKSKEWLEDAAGAQIPDTESLQADDCGPGYS